MMPVTGQFIHCMKLATSSTHVPGISTGSQFLQAKVATSILSKTTDTGSEKNIM